MHQHLLLICATAVVDGATTLSAQVEGRTASTAVAVVASALIGAAGGVFAATDANAQVTIPAGSLRAERAIRCDACRQSSRNLVIRAALPQGRLLRGRWRQSRRVSRRLAKSPPEPSPTQTPILPDPRVLIRVTSRAGLASSLTRTRTSVGVT